MNKWADFIGLLLFISNKLDLIYLFEVVKTPNTTTTTTLFFFNTQKDKNVYLWFYNH